MPKKPVSPSRDLELPPPNVDGPDDGSMDFQQVNHESVIQHLGEDRWADAWAEILEKQAQGLQIERLDK